MVAYIRIALVVVLVAINALLLSQLWMSPVCDCHRCEVGESCCWIDVKPLDDSQK